MSQIRSSIISESDHYRRVFLIIANTQTRRQHVVSIMSDGDRSWLDALASFEAPGTAVDLLDGLLHAPHEEESMGPTSMTVPTSGRRQKKRNRVTTWRASDEIRRLRESARDLESALALLRSSHRQREAGCTGSTAEMERARVWRAVAMRQLQYLHQSQDENEQLHKQVHKQRALLNDMARLWRRASVGLQSVALPPRRPILQDASLVQRTRHELLARALHLYQAADQVVVSKWFNAAELAVGKRVTTVHRHAKYVIPPGSTLVSSRLGLLVPVSIDALKARLWDQEGNRPPHNTIEHVERSSHYYFFFSSYQLQHEDGVAMFHTALVRHCFYDDAHHVITMAGALWPLETALSPGNPIEFELNATAVLQPSVVDASLTEVRVYLHSARRAEAIVPAEMTKEEAATLSSFVASAHNFLLDSLERDIDNALLNRLTN